MNTNMPSSTLPMEDHGVVSLGLGFEPGVVAFWNKLVIFMGYSLYKNPVFLISLGFYGKAIMSCHELFQPKRIANSDIWIV